MMMGVLPPPGLEDVVPYSAMVPQTVAVRSPKSPALRKPNSPKSPLKVAFNTTPQVDLFDPLANPSSPTNVMSSDDRQHLELIRRNAELKEQLALIRNAELLRRQNAELKEQMFLMSNSLALSKNPLQYSGWNRDASPTTSTAASETGESSDDQSSMDQDEFRETTVMLRNIPNEYTRADFLALMDREGFKGLYDLFYLPVDFQTELNHGYAFVNFTTAENAERFRQRFAGFSDWQGPSENICEAFFSDQSQGIDANIQRYRNSTMMHESVEDRFKPVLFQNGQRIPFPKPTKKIRAPQKNRYQRAQFDAVC